MSSGGINSIGSTNDPAWDGSSANPSVISLLKAVYNALVGV